MKKKIIGTVVFAIIAVLFTLQAFAGVDPYNAYQNRMQLYTSQFYLTIDSLDALTRKLDSLITGQNADTAAVSAAIDSITATHTAVGGVQADATIILDSLALTYVQAKGAHDTAVRDSTALAKAQDSLNYLVAGNDDIYALVDTAAWRGYISMLSGATSLPSETTDTIATVTGEVEIQYIGFRVTTALAAEYIKLGFWATNTDGAAAATALCDSAGMTDLTGSVAGTALNLTGVFANNPTVTAFNVAAVAGMPAAIRVKNCVLTIGSGTAVTSSGKVRYVIRYVPLSAGSRVTFN